MPAKKKIEAVEDGSEVIEKKVSKKSTKKKADSVSDAKTAEKPAKKTRKKKTDEVADVKVPTEKVEATEKKSKKTSKKAKAEKSELVNDAVNNVVEEKTPEKAPKKKNTKKSAKKEKDEVKTSIPSEVEKKEETKKPSKKSSSSKKSGQKEEKVAEEAVKPIDNTIALQEKPQKKTKSKAPKKEKKISEKAEVASEEVKVEEVKIAEEKPAKKSSKKASEEKKAPKAKKTAKKTEAVKSEVVKAEEKPKKENKKANAPKKSKEKKQDKPGKKVSKKNTTEAIKPVVIDRDAIYAEVFGYSINDSKVAKPKKETTKAKKPAKKNKAKTEKKEEKVATVFDREKVFEAVFGYDPNFKAVAKTEKKTKKNNKKATKVNKEEVIKPAAPVAPTKTYEIIKPGKETEKVENETKPAPNAKVSSFFGFGKLSAEDIANLRSKKNEASEGPKQKPEKKQSKSKQAQEVIETPKVQEEIKVLVFDRDKIFAEVFSLVIKEEKIEQKPAEKKETKQNPKKGNAQQKKEPAKPAPAPQKKKQKSTIFKIFANKGKKKRPGFEAPKKPEKVEPVFNRDEVFAQVFGYELKPSEETKVVNTPVKPAIKTETKTEVKVEEAKVVAKEETNKEKTKNPPVLSGDKDLENLIRSSYTGNYPKTVMTKPLTDSEKRIALSFEDFFKSRGYNLDFAESGANKTGIVTARIIESGSMLNVLDFFNKTKSEISKAICGNDDAYKTFVESDKPFYVVFDASKRKIIEAARGFGIVTNVRENSDGTLNVQFSKFPKVIDYFRGGFLESYAYYVAKSVARSVADKYKLSFEVAANAIVTDNNGKMIHEYDTMIKLGNIVFILEEKSSRHFSDFDKFSRDMDELKFNKQNYMILLMNKNNEEMTAIEWFFDFRVANLSNFAQKLENMFVEAVEGISL